MKNATLYAPLYERERVVPGDSFNTISSKKGVAMLIAQTAIESAYYAQTVESLNYSIDALKTLTGWDKEKKRYFRYFTDEQAERYGYIRDYNRRIIRPADERMIANLYYGGRNGNRGVDTNDGWDFRGSSHIQLTGRHNITGFGNSLGMDVYQAANYARTPAGAVAGALWYWRNHDLLVPASRGDIVTCTKLVQGGNKHLDKRTDVFNAVLPLL